MKKYSVPFTKLVMLLMGGILSLNIASAQWVSNGPYGGYILCFAVGDSVIYTGTNGNGVYSSTDNGNTWILQNNGLANMIVNALAVQGNYVYAGTDSGIFISSDKGTNWVAMDVGMVDSPFTTPIVTSIAIKGSSIFTATSNAGVFFLPNSSSTTWTAVNNGLLNAWPVNSLLISGENIFTGTAAGVFLSTNNGASWTPMNTGLDEYDSYIYCMANSGTNIFAGTYSGIILSVDNGNTWTQPDTGIPYGWRYIDIHSLAVEGSNIFAGTDGAGIFLSNNNGLSWTPANNGVFNPYITALTVNSTDIFAGTPGNVLLSADTGKLWADRNTSIIGTYVQSLAVNRDTIFAGTPASGVFLSVDNGSHWTAVNTNLKDNNFYALGISGSYVFASTDSGVFISTNHGGNWALDTSFPKNNIAYSFAIKDSYIFAGTENGVFLSTNFGINWISFNNNIQIVPVSAFAFDDSNILAGAGYLSESPINNDNWTTFWQTDGIASLAVNPPNIFASVRAAGIWLSTNNGVDWAEMSSGLPPSEGYMLGVNHSDIFAGGYGEGVFLSTDAGSYWRDINAGLPTLNAYTLATNDSNIFVGTGGAGVWQRLLADLPAGLNESPSIVKFKLYPNPTLGNFVLETACSGSQKLQLFDLTGQLLLTQLIQTGKTTIDVGNLAAGVYIVSLKSVIGLNTQKLVITE